MSDNFKTYWLTKYVEASNEKTIYPAGSEVIDNFGSDGACTDALTANASKDDNIIMMVYADQNVVDRLTAMGLKRLDNTMSKISTVKLALKSKIIKESYPELKEINGIL